MTIPVLILVLALCLLLEGFFSGSELALVNADKYRLALAADSGSRRALMALHLIRHPATFFSTTLLGTNLCAITGSVVTTLFLIDRLGPAYAGLAILYWPFALVFGEIVPKSVYQFFADRSVLWVAPVLYGISILFSPAVWIFSKLTDKLLGGVRRREGVAPPVSREELELMLEVGRAEGSDVKPAERTLVSRIFDLADKNVANIMTPLVDVVALPASVSRVEAELVLEKHAYTRVPVYDVSVFNIVGVLAGTDLLFGDGQVPVSKLLKPAFFVPVGMPLDELFVAMKRKGELLAVAVDEYGAAAGIVTAEDILEEIVGEIRDEHDEAPALYRRLGWHHYFISGRMEVEQANERLKLGIPPGAYETVAGFVVQRLERIPAAGEGFRFGRHRFIVARASERAVLEIEVRQEGGAGSPASSS